MTPEEYESHLKNTFEDRHLIDVFIAAVTKDMKTIIENLQYIIVEDSKQKLIDEFMAMLSAMNTCVRETLPETMFSRNLCEEYASALISAGILMHHKFMLGDIPELSAIQTKQFMESHDLVHDIEWPA